jgi:hypothetical protein
MRRMLWVLFNDCTPILDRVVINHKTQFMAPPSRQLCAIYFTPVIINDTAKTGHWTCNKCGWTNLLNHARSCVGPSFESDFERLHHLSGKNSAITSFVIRVNETEREMYKWIEWVIMKNQPLSIVDDPLTREGMRYRPVTSKLLRQNILLLCKEMQAISNVSYLTSLHWSLMAGLKELYITLVCLPRMWQWSIRRKLSRTLCYLWDLS